MRTHNAYRGAEESDECAGGDLGLQLGPVYLKLLDDVLVPRFGRQPCPNHLVRPAAAVRGALNDCGRGGREEGRVHAREGAHRRGSPGRLRPNWLNLIGAATASAHGSPEQQATASASSVHGARRRPAAMSGVRVTEF